MTLNYVLLLGVIGVPLMLLIFRMIPTLGLLFEISASLWMLPI